MPGLDFERYLQPSLRCSLSPGGAVAMETLSPMATPLPVASDVEMESPKGPSEESPAGQETGTVLPQYATSAHAALCEHCDCLV